MAIVRLKNLSFKSRGKRITFKPKRPKNLFIGNRGQVLTKSRYNAFRIKTKNINIAKSISKRRLGRELKRLTNQLVYKKWKGQINDDVVETLTNLIKKHYEKDTRKGIFQLRQVLTQNYSNKQTLVKIFGRAEVDEAKIRFANEKGLTVAIGSIARGYDDPYYDTDFNNKLQDYNELQHKEQIQGLTRAEREQKNAIGQEINAEWDSFKRQQTNQRVTDLTDILAGK